MRLQRILRQAEGPIIIFANQKKSVEILTKTVEKWGWSAVMYHGSKTQEQSAAAVGGFKKSK